MPYKEKKVEKLFFTIGEVSRTLDVPVSTVRYWENEFEILKPKKNRKGNRLFTQEDMKNVRLIHHLLKENGMTIAGARKYLKSHGAGDESRHEILESLKNIREMLVEIRDNI